MLQSNLFELITIIFYCILIFIPLLLGVVLALYADRKIWAGVQKKKGP